MSAWLEANRKKYINKYIKVKACSFCRLIVLLCKLPCTRVNMYIFSLAPKNVECKMVQETSEQIRGLRLEDAPMQKMLDELKKEVLDQEMKFRDSKK